MSRSVRQAAVCSLALAAVLVAANSSFAGCGGGRYRGHYNHYPTYHAPVVHHVTRPVVHVTRPVVHVTRPVVHVAPPVVAVAPPVVAVAPPVVAPRPVKVVPQLPSVPAGSTLSLPGNFLGPVAGHVFLVVNDVKLPAQIIAWNPNGVTLKLPPMAVKQPSPARIDVIMPHGQVINKVKILLTAPASLVIHQSAPATPLPTGPAAAPVQAAAPQVGAPLVLNQ